jgi:hypothetical protein
MRVGWVGPWAKDLELCQIKQKGLYNRPKEVWRGNDLPKAKETPPKPCYTQDPTKFSLSEPGWK